LPKKDLAPSKQAKRRGKNSNKKSPDGQTPIFFFQVADKTSCPHHCIQRAPWKLADYHPCHLMFLLSKTSSKNSSNAFLPPPLSPRQWDFTPSMKGFEHSIRRGKRA